MYRIALLLFLPALSGFPQSETKREISDEFRKHFVQKVLRLKHFCMENTQTFTASGEPRTPCRPGPWTIYSPILIEKISQKERRLRIQGTRVAAGWEQGALKYFNQESGIQIDIEMDEPPDDRSAKLAMARVFVSEGEEFADLVPVEWKSFLAKKTSGAEDPPPPSEGTPLRVMTSSGVTAGLLIQRAVPAYPDLAKTWRRQGTVILQAIISKEGDIKDLKVRVPVGFGLEEAAIEAVKRWKYRPYLFKGEPVEMETTIYVRFQLSAR